MSKIVVKDILRLAGLFCKAAEAEADEYELIGTFHAALPIKGNLKGIIEQITSNGKVEYSVHKSNVSDHDLEDGEGKKCSFTLGYIGRKPVAILTRFLE